MSILLIRLSCPKSSWGNEVIILFFATTRTTNAILHPWLKHHLSAILEQCPPAPEVVPKGRRWQDWDIYPAAEQLDRFLPPISMVLISDNLAGHKSPSITQWCAEHGIVLLSTSNAGSWINMTESVQRIIKRRALQGYHVYDVEILKDWFRETIEGWNRHPTPIIWGGKRHARRDRAYARRHRLGDQERRHATSSQSAFVPFAPTGKLPHATVLGN